MKILKSDEKKGFMHLLCQTQEDLWELSYLIDPSDVVRGTTERKIKIGDADSRNQKVIRKKMTLSLRAEKSEYAHEVLKVLGIIVDGPDDVARGDHHSISFSEGDTISITKQQWLSWQKEKISDACKNVQENIVVVLFDREDAQFYQLTTKGHKSLGSLKGDVAKKDMEGTTVKNFWKEITDEITSLNKRISPRSIILGSAAFWKEYVQDLLTDDVKKKVVFATVSDLGENGLKELGKRPELKSALAQDRTSQEEAEVETILFAMAKDKAAYGIDDVENATNEGNLSSLTVSTLFLMHERDEGDYQRVEKVMKAAESINAKIMILTSKDASKQLDGVGGIAGIKRW